VQELGARVGVVGNSSFATEQKTRVWLQIISCTSNADLTGCNLTSALLPGTSSLCNQPTDGMLRPWRRACTSPRRRSQQQQQQQQPSSRDWLSLSFVLPHLKLSLWCDSGLCHRCPFLSVPCCSCAVQADAAHAVLARLSSVVPPC
jgi:hypothetical protein